MYIINSHSLQTSAWVPHLGLVLQWVDTDEKKTIESAVHEKC